ncbi:MAG: polyhydroxyalkanoate depolymerase [Bdellovibrionales bacterium]|jgi:poly(3-hydroxybutyrate) depolymerase
MFLYQLLDMQNMALAPWNSVARFMAQTLKSAQCPTSRYECGRALEAQIAMFERSTRFHEKPPFNIKSTKFRGEPIEVEIKTVHKTPFCHLLHFDRATRHPEIAQHLVGDPKLLIITPMSGHFATLMRGTVEAMLPSHDVYITDWVDAKNVPLSQGYFDLEDQIGYLMDVIQSLGANLHLLAISQASVSILCAVALLAEQETPVEPLSMTLIGGPIDARGQPCALSEEAKSHSLSWFRTAQIQMVPTYYAGAFRRVYPGIMQLLDRMAMSLDSHITEQVQYYRHLVRGDDDAVEAHEAFYNEFLAVMDVPEEFHLQYIERAYQRHDLANGSFVWRSSKVNPATITKTALLTVEGELDDLSPAGHTRAALDLCSNLPAEMKQSHLEIGVGHYGVFNGRKWRNNIQPLVHQFIRKHSATGE